MKFLKMLFCNHDYEYEYLHKVDGVWQSYIVAPAKNAGRWYIKHEFTFL